MPRLLTFVGFLAVTTEPQSAVYPGTTELPDAREKIAGKVQDLLKRELPGVDR